MNSIKRLLVLVMWFGLGCASVEKQTLDYLEVVEGEEALAWVEAQNKRSLSVLESDRRYPKFLQAAEAIVSAKDRIPYAQYRGGSVYNFWQDEKHVRGLLRSTTLERYKNRSPRLGDEESIWTTILDIDELAKVENENWVYKGNVCLAPNYTRCLIRLSRGGTDASVYREFDIEAKRFVPNGFVMPESKGSVAWVDEDTLLVGTKWGPTSMTRSGYPKESRIWRRGTPLSDAKLIFEGNVEDVGVWSSSFHLPSAMGEKHRIVPIIIRSKTFFTSQYLLVLKDGVLTLPLPESSEIRGLFGRHLLVSLRDEWNHEGQVHTAGSLVALPLNEVETGKVEHSETIWAPSTSSSLSGVSSTKGFLYLSILDDVKSKISRLSWSELKGWESHDVPLSGTGSARFVSAYTTEDIAFVNFESFTTPDQLFMLKDETVAAFSETPVNGVATSLLDALPPRFNADGTQVLQRFVESSDGTKVPYYLVTPKGYKPNGQTPTLLYGYGGFEVSLTPSYRATFGKLWLEQGGAYVIANIRGGGEYGPRWHQAALKERRQLAYDDFLAVAKDLIDQKVTSPSKLGIMGGSNGGLLVGVAFTQKPERFGAVVCQVPLLDMMRYTKLLAGASWMGEYGDPEDPKMTKVIRNYSPFHNLRPDATYPVPFFVTSTKDDRVHPGHARKMAALMQKLGHPFYYFENTEGGHGASANLKQTARRIALEFVYLSKRLGLE